MDIVVNSVYTGLTEQSTRLTIRGSALVDYLMCLDYGAQQLPLADLLARSRGLDGHWVILSPMYWEASHNDAVIVATGEELALSEEQSRHWFELFSKVFAVDGHYCVFYDAQTWLLSIPDMPPLHAKPVHQLLNQSLMPELKQLGASMYWQKLFTEGQMFFASQAQNEPLLLNGLWAWGSGLLTLKNKTIIADASFLPFATLTAAHVMPYNPTVSLGECDILLIESMDVLSDEHKKQLKKISAHWFWRNSEYIHQNIHWFTRFWRSLFHAN